MKFPESKTKRRSQKQSENKGRFPAEEWKTEKPFKQQLRMLKD